MKLAGFWLRAVAHLIDDVLLGAGVGMLLLVGVRLPAAIALVVLLFAWIYFAGMESSRHQATLGKMALRLHVTDLQGRPLSFGRATGRYFAKLITGLIPLGVGYAMAGFTEKKQALHDMIAGSLVVRP
jgi:uncharacterized RDD family membrane protein YckC